MSDLFGGTTGAGSLSWKGPFCLGDGKRYRLVNGGVDTDFSVTNDDKRSQARLYADKPYTVWDNGKSTTGRPIRHSSFEKLADAKSHAIAKFNEGKQS